MHDKLVSSGKFCANVLSPGDQEVASAFSDPEKRTERFQYGDWGALVTGSPSLRTAQVSFDCRIVQTVRVGTHTICIGEIVTAECPVGDVSPLIYSDGRYGEVAAI